MHARMERKGSWSHVEFATGAALVAIGIVGTVFTLGLSDVLVPAGLMLMGVGEVTK